MKWAEDTQFLDGRFCWIANDSLLTVLRHSSRTVVASKKFSTCLPDDVLWTIVSCKVGCFVSGTVS